MLYNMSMDSQFQPTLPMRGETRPGPIPAYTVQFQPTLPMRGETVSLG